MTTVRRCSLLILFLALTAGMALQAGATGYVTLGKNAEPLRGTFNSEIGKVRIMLLIAPH